MIGIDATYSRLLYKVLEYGTCREDRTGTGTLSLSGQSLECDLSKDGFPILHGKSVHWKSVVEELLWFIRGDTRVENLSAKGVRIWDEWNNDDGTIGPGYGVGWRNWYDPFMKPENLETPEVDTWERFEVSNEPFDVTEKISSMYEKVVDRPNISPVWDSLYKFARTIHFVPGYNQALNSNSLKFNPQHVPASFISPSTAAFVPEGIEQGLKVSVDQLAECIELIKNDPTSRRIIVNAWNPAQISNMALPPCHMFFQFYVADGDKLDMVMYQRSADMFLGVPFNISSYALLLSMVAQVTGKTPRKLRMNFGDSHIYVNHLDQVTTYLNRISGVSIQEASRPHLVLDSNIDDIDLFTSSSIELVGYNPMPAIKAKVAV